MFQVENANDAVCSRTARVFSPTDDHGPSAIVVSRPPLAATRSHNTSPSELHLNTSGLNEVVRRILFPIRSALGVVLSAITNQDCALNGLMARCRNSSRSAAPERCTSSTKCATIHDHVAGHFRKQQTNHENHPIICPSLAEAPCCGMPFSPDREVHPSLEALA